MNGSKKNWHLDHRTDDLRGWPVLDASGSLIGEVIELLVDTDSGYVTTVVLIGGRKLPAHEMQIGDGVLTMLAPPEEPQVASPPPEEKPVEKRVSDDLFVQLVDEELEVGTREFDAGGVHLESHTISEPVTREVTLHEERVTISRNKVDRALDVKDANQLFHDETYEVTATAEVPVINKYAHVVEEIVLKKNAISRDETVHETVRHMEADITELRENEALQGARR